MKKSIVDPKKEALIVRHSYLNSGSYDEKIYDQLPELAKYTNGRQPVNCLEGDLLQVRETGEPILTHEDWFSVSKDRYRALRQEKIACSLEEALCKARTYQIKHPDNRLVLCLEPKLTTDKETIERAMKLLKQYGFSEETAYFDSFYGNKLDRVAELNQESGSAFLRSYHMLLGNLGNLKLTFPFTPAKKGYDLVSTQYPTSFGKFNGPKIYGAVGSLKALEEVTKDPEVLGAYLRLREGGGLTGMLKMLSTSASNNNRKRGNHNK